MKIVKRDGRTVEYNPDKIRIAIGKANDEVIGGAKISEAEIEDIINYIESLDKKRMLVEDIQDIIEEKLMEKSKYSLAKKYIIYRYTRSIIRKSNTTDASIMSLLKNGEVSSSGYLVANRQRDVMAGEASKDLAYRLLLPKNVVEAEKNGTIKFCNVEYFTEPIIESLKINISEMLENGIVLNGVKIDPPKSFQSACNILVEVITSLASSQTGAIYIDFSELFKYYYLSFEKHHSLYSAFLKKDFSVEEINALTRTQTFLEVASGVQTLIYQINTITLASGLVPEVYFLVDPSKCCDSMEEQIILEFFKQKDRGLTLEDGSISKRRYPMIVYSYDSKNHGMNEEFLQHLNASIVMSEKRYEKFYKDISKFNQGSIILNMAKIALLAKDNGGDFIQELEKNLNICYEGMLCRNHNLQGIYSDKSPIHWQHGGIAKLAKEERIDSLLKRDHSYMQLIVIGFEASMKILGEDLKKEAVNCIENCIKTWNKESMFSVKLANFYEENVIKSLFINQERDVLHELGVDSLFDSSEFMEEDYFKGDFLYLSCDNVESLSENDDYILRVL